MAEDALTLVRSNAFARAGRTRWSLLLMVLSGFAGLGYQIIWLQQCALWLGHEAAAVLAVVAAFFGGMAVGALLFGERIERSMQPVYWYVACELLVALWSALLLYGMSPFSTWMLQLTGAEPTPVWQWLVAFVGVFALLLPATVAMGATLPAIERIFSARHHAARSIASLYAANTFGAVLGVLATAFWLVPEFGLSRNAVLCVALNLICAAASLMVFGTDAVNVDNIRTSYNRPAANRLLTLLTFTGLLGIGYEVLVVRVLSEVAEDTVYTFAMLLAVYLVGTSLGAFLYQRFSRRAALLADDEKQRTVSDGLLTALAVACLVGTTSLWGAEYVKAATSQWLGFSMSAALAGEAMLAIVAFALPTILMGVAFSHLTACASAAGVGFGRALGVNTLGAAIAPLMFGVIGLPWLGAKLSLVIVVIGYLSLVTWRTWRKPVVWLPASIALAIAVFAPRLAFIAVPDGGHVVSYKEGVMAAVSVVEDANGVAVLRINNRQQEGSSASLRVDARQAWLPLLLHSQPKRALFLGLGTGVTAYSAAEDPSLKADAVELLPEVITASKYFTRRDGDDVGHATPRLVAADARRYVRATTHSYDVIISDNFHPARSGSASLYTVEHFKAVRERLSEDGVFCQWLPLHQLDLDTLRSIVKSFVMVYPHGWAMLASNSLETPVVGLIGRRDAMLFDVDGIRRRIRDSAVARGLTAIGIEDEWALLGSFIAGPEALKQFADDAIVNTDDHPIVAYRAPRITYAADSLPRDRLIALLHQTTARADEVINTTSKDSSHRLESYWQARNRFIEMGHDVQPSADVHAMLRQVREPLLSVLRISADFRPAYDPLLRMAEVLMPSDATTARALLTELDELQPAHVEAHQLLQQATPRD